MIIKSCYIENFGTFHDQTFSFTDGINVIKEENGWGKSTLAVFIKSMFYGMEYSRKRKQMTEYKKYEPWQGGKYGGFLIFCVGGKEYKVIRYFGKKESESVFELYDTLTNKPNSDYSANLGEELFGIDCASFERSIFIKLDGEQRTPELSDSISAKLNNLIDNTDDINNFETAYETLDKLAASIVPKRGSNGMIGALEEEIRKTNDVLFACDNAEREMELLRGKICRVSEEQKNFETTRKQMSQELDAFNLSDKKERYNKLVKEMHSLCEEHNGFAKFFQYGVPTEEELALRMKETNDIGIYRSKCAEIERVEEKKKKLVDIESFFAGHIPSEDEIDECRKKIAAYGRERERLAGCKLSEAERERYHSLRQSFGEQLPTDEQLDACVADYERAVRLTSDITDKKGRLTELRAAHTAARPNVAATVAFAALILVGAVAAITMSNLFAKWVALIVVLAGAAGVGILFAKRRKKPSTEVAALEKEIQDLQQACEASQERCRATVSAFASIAETENVISALNNIRIAWNEMKNLEEKMQRYETERRNSTIEKYCAEIECFLGRYGTGNTTEDYTQRLSSVADNLHAYTYLIHETSAYDKAKTEEEKVKARLLPFLEQYPASGDTYFEKMQDIRDRALAYKTTEDKLNRARVELEEFKSKNDTEALLNVKCPEISKDELEERIQECSSKINECTSEIAKAERDIERQSVVADKRQETESERLRLDERKEYLSKKHGILKETMELLEQAKEKLTATYMSDMTPAFQKYIHMIEPEQEAMILTSELETQILHNGRQWESGYHSRGYADMVNVCTRLALADVMYREESPFLIFDDPFVNLDDNKTEHALEFLKQLGAQKQIFYFTCHASRSIL